MSVLVYGSIPLGALLAGELGTALSVRTALRVILTLYAVSGTLLLTPALRAGKNLPSQTATVDESEQNRGFDHESAR
jgi:hypothetical protein